MIFLNVLCQVSGLFFFNKLCMNIIGHALNSNWPPCILAIKRKGGLLCQWLAWLHYRRWFAWTCFLFTCLLTWHSFPQGLHGYMNALVYDRSLYWPPCVGTPTKGRGGLWWNRLAWLAYHRDKMPTKVIPDMNRKVVEGEASNIWLLVRKGLGLNVGLKSYRAIKYPFLFNAMVDQSKFKRDHRWLVDLTGVGQA